LFASACSDESLSDGKSDGDEVTLHFNLSVDDFSETRSLGETNALSVSMPIYAIVFDENHYYLKYEKIDLNDPKVTLNATSQTRYIHFIANHSLSATNTPFMTDGYLGTESDVFNDASMVVSNSNDVYWQREELKGISENTSIGTVKLIRNFAKISIAFDDDIPESEREVTWTVVNKPKYGSVAPFISGQSFADYHGEYSFDSIRENYVGHLLRAENSDSFYDTSTPSESSWLPASGSMYTYENDNLSSESDYKETRLLIKHIYNGTTYYYTVLISDSDHNLLPILRNFEYVVTIESIGEGYASADDALASPPGNNISASTATKELTGVSNGTSSLRVEFIEKVLVTDDDITLKFRYVPVIPDDVSASGALDSDNEKVKISVANGKVIRDMSVDYSVDDEGYSLVTFKINNPDLSIRSQEIQFKVEDPDHSGNNNLYRVVTLYLRRRYQWGDMTVEYYSNNDSAYGTNQGSFNAWAQLPKGLPKSIFPLYFTFETDPLYVFPDVLRSVMTTQTDQPSIFDSTKKNTYSYRYKFTYDAYITTTNTSTDGGWAYPYFTYRKTTNTWHSSITTSNYTSLDYVIVGFYFKFNYVLFGGKNSISNYPVKFGIYSNYLSTDPTGDIDSDYATALQKTYNLSITLQNGYMWNNTPTLTEVN
jgi:hypothetical protein